MTGIAHPRGFAVYESVRFVPANRSFRFEPATRLRRRDTTPRVRANAPVVATVR